MSATTKLDAGIVLDEGQVIDHDEARAFDRSEPEAPRPRLAKFDGGIVLPAEPSRMAPFDRQQAIDDHLVAIDVKLDAIMAKLGIKA